MRVSSQHIFNIAMKSMAEVNRGVVDTQEQMSSGKRVLSPSDDPVAATKIMQLNDELYRSDQYQKNIDIAQNNLMLEESVLGGVTNVIQRMQELSVAAGNTASLTPNEYQAMASEVEARLDELLNLMNSKNAGGDYIFGGYKSKTPPFEGNSLSGYQYKGNDGQQRIQIASNTNIETSDSGKTTFLDVDSTKNTFDSYASPSNQSQPAARISVGYVYDQAEFDKFYPEDIAIQFNDDTSINPPGKNFSAVERSTGRTIVANQRFVSGEEIRINGASIRISGDPSSGSAAVPSTRYFGIDSPTAYPVDFSGANQQSFTLTVGKHTETLIVDAVITNQSDLANTLNSAGNGNAQKLAKLGIVVNDLGFSLNSGQDFRLANGSANLDAVLGLDSSNGSQSIDGAVARAGDQFFIDSSEKQGLLTTLARFKEVISQYDGSSDGKELVSDMVATTLDNLSNAQTAVLDVVSKIGARVNTLESTRDLHLDTDLVSKEVMSQLRDLDYAEAAARLSQQTLILQAAQQSFIRVSQLNLFSRL